MTHHTPLVVLLSLVAAITPIADAAGQDGSDYAHVESSANVSTIHPGERFVLAFRFTIEPQWHIYWTNPGDTGAPTNITVTGPEGFKIGQTLYPRPMSIPGELLTYGYEGEAVLFVPIAAPDELETGTVEFTANVSFLVCKDSCLLGDVVQTVTLETTSEPLPDASDEGESTDQDRTAAPGKAFEDESLEAAYRALPKRLKRIKRGKSTLEENRAVFVGPARGATAVQFFPNHTPGVTATIVEQVVERDQFRVVLDFEVNEANTQDVPPRIRGVVALGSGSTDPSFEVTLPIRSRRQTDTDEEKGIEATAETADDNSDG